jgi:hypothetical protein
MVPLTSITIGGILQSATCHSVFSSFVEMGNEAYQPHLSSTDADKATLSSTASLEGDDKDDDVNAASTTASAPHANTDADEQPTVITLPLSAVTTVGLLRSAPWHSVFSCFGTNVSLLPSAPGHNVFSSFVEIGNEAYQPHFSSTDANEDTLSSPASLEGDDEDDDVNAASTPASAPHANTDADERPTVITLPLSAVTNVGLILRSAPWHSVFTADADE